MDNIDQLQQTKPAETKVTAAPSEPKAEYAPKNQKQGQLTSSLDDHGYAPTQEKKWSPPDEYSQKKTVSVPAKNPTAQKKQMMLASSFAGHDATRFYE